MTLRQTRYGSDCLIKSNLFNLPKYLPEGDGIDWNVVIVDATEILIQRPKKTEEKAIVAREKVILLRYRRSFIIELRKS